MVDVFIKNQNIRIFKMATEERNIENIDLAEEGKEVNGIGNEPLSEERKEEIINEITKVNSTNQN